MDSGRLHKLLDEGLQVAAARITGNPTCPARPGQVQLAHDILQAMIGQDGTPGHVAGAAPTGVGKGLAVALPLFLMVAEAGHRGVVSTESKALQAQLIDKDYPLVAGVVKDLTGVQVSYAVHKGFANYVCAAATEATAAELLGLDDRAPRGKHARISEVDLRGLAEQLSGHACTPGAQVEVDGRLVEGQALAELTAWALNESLADGLGDRSLFEGVGTDGLWSHVSVSPDECVGGDCPLIDICPAQRAREQAGQADVVVTNHALLALQAANGVPVVFNNTKLGLFHHLAVDEAHSLPQIVRSSGSSQISARRVGMLTRQVNDLVGSSAGMRNARADLVVEAGHRLATAIDMALGGFMLGRGDVARYDTDKHPLARLQDAIEDWVAQAKALLPKESRVSSMKARVRIKRANAGLSSLAEDLADSADPDREVARWVEADRDGALALRVSPVDVSAQIAGNLFSVKVEESEEDKAVREALGDPPPKMPLSVSMVSATMSPGFGFEAGVRARVVEYASPFDQAYGDSLLYVPKVTTDAELARIASRNGTRWRFDVSRHPDWAAERIVELVRANGGRALILASTRRAGELYADVLRAAHTEHAVFSQWDGLDPRRLVEQWRADMTSVLVGTRSLWTGVDAAGETCSLVIVDRAPRNPANVVDDARSELLAHRQNLDKWTADRAVYVADAALLLEQAAGRLIRRVDDAGMVAVMDPRLMKATPISYPEQTRVAYMRALRRFSARTNNLDAALGFLSGRRDQLAA